MPPSISELIARNTTSYAGWCGLGSAFGIELVADAGFDLVLIDQQHGFGGQSELMNGLIAARAGGIPACVRVAWNDAALIGRALDAGAHGVVCPMINTAGDARALVQASKYPPLGGRSWGAYRGKLLLDGDLLENANGWAKAFAQIETAEGLANLNDILAVDGLDGILVGPNDLAISMTGKADVSEASVLAAITQIYEKTTAAKKLTWIFANDAKFAKPLVAAGWQILTIATDHTWLRAGAEAALKSVKPV